MESYPVPTWNYIHLLYRRFVILLLFRTRVRLPNFAYKNFNFWNGRIYTGEQYSKEEEEKKKVFLESI